MRRKAAPMQNAECKMQNKERGTHYFTLPSGERSETEGIETPSTASGPPPSKMEAMGARALRRDQGDHGVAGEVALR